MELEKAPNRSETEIADILATQEAAYPSREGWGWKYLEYPDGRGALVNEDQHPEVASEPE